MADRFEDERGVIQDLFNGEKVAVTRILTNKGAIRGNHVHKRTTQWTTVLTGWLQVANGTARFVLGPGQTAVHMPGDPHAWKALEDTDCLVFTQGPRSGVDYESDTERLTVSLL